MQGYVLCAGICHLRRRPRRADRPHGARGGGGRGQRRRRDRAVHTAQQATVEDMVASDAIILGSPNWHGMTADLKQVVDKTGLIWEQGKLVGKVGAAFTSGWSRAGGQEITLLTMLHSLLAHGMLIVGLPWSKRMVKSGSYYGPTATGGPTEDDLAQAHALGRRVAPATPSGSRPAAATRSTRSKAACSTSQRRGHVVTR